mmetsp:Transcript_13176/g.27904  ORF Transcript_13176/g.27904 Transcript_13176/m.27904 type:complete len:359 (-) Transcript_13176:774-1850(-)
MLRLGLPPIARPIFTPLLLLSTGTVGGGMHGIFLHLPPRRLVRLKWFVEVAPPPAIIIPKLRNVLFDPAIRTLVRPRPPFPARRGRWLQRHLLTRTAPDPVVVVVVIVVFMIHTTPPVVSSMMTRGCSRIGHRRGSSGLAGVKLVVLPGGTFGVVVVGSSGQVDRIPSPGHVARIVLPLVRVGQVSRVEPSGGRRDLSTRKRTVVVAILLRATASASVSLMMLSILLLLRNGSSGSSSRPLIPILIGAALRVGGRLIPLPASLTTGTGTATSPVPVPAALAIANAIATNTMTPTTSMPILRLLLLLLLLMLLMALPPHPLLVLGGPSLGVGKGVHVIRLGRLEHLEQDRHLIHHLAHD